MTVMPYVPMFSDTTTSPAAMAFTGVPRAAWIPMPFQRSVVFSGVTVRPNR